MRIIGCDLHARQQTLAMLDTTTGEVANLTLMHEGNCVREFYSKLPPPLSQTEGVRHEGGCHSTSISTVFVTKTPFQFCLFLPNHRPARQQREDS